jgi:hypothetical protein
MSFLYCTYCNEASIAPYCNDRCPKCGAEAATVPLAPPGYAPIGGALQAQHESIWQELCEAKAMVQPLREDFAILSRECDRLEAENALMRSRLNNSPNIVRRRRCAG